MNVVDALHDPRSRRIQYITALRDITTHVYFACAEDPETYLPPGSEIHACFTQRMEEALRTPIFFFEIPIPRHLRAITFALTKDDWMDVAATLCRRLPRGIVQDENNMLTNNLWAAVALHFMRTPSPATRGALRNMLAARVLTHAVIRSIVDALSGEICLRLDLNTSIVVKMWLAVGRKLAASAVSDGPTTGLDTRFFANRASADLMQEVLEGMSCDVTEAILRPIRWPSCSVLNLPLWHFMHGRMGGDPKVRCTEQPQVIEQGIRMAARHLAMVFASTEICRAAFKNNVLCCPFSDIWGANGMFALCMRESQIVESAEYWYHRCSAPLDRLTYGGAHNYAGLAQLDEWGVNRGTRTDHRIEFVVCAYAMGVKLHRYITELTAGHREPGTFDYNMFVGWDRPPLFERLDARRMIGATLVRCGTYAQFKGLLRKCPFECADPDAPLSTATVDRWAKTWLQFLQSCIDTGVLTENRDFLWYALFDPDFVRVYLIKRKKRHL